MKMKIFILSAMFLMIAAVSFSATDNNAALRYLMAIGHMPAIEENVINEFAAISASQTVDGISSAAAEIAAKMDTRKAFSLIVNGAKLTECDFTPDNRRFSPEDHSPPYRALRNLARIAAAQAWLLEKRGNLDGAFELLTATIIMGSHLSKNDVLIGALVGKAIAEIGVRGVAEFFRRHPEPRFREQFSAKLASLPRPIINIMGAMKGERQFLVWADGFISRNAERIRNLDNPASSSAHTEGAINLRDLYPEELRKLAGTAELNAMNQEAFALYDKVLALAPTDPDLASKAELIANEAGLGTGTQSKNYWFKNTIPNFTKAFLHVVNLEKEIDQLLRP